MNTAGILEGGSIDTTTIEDWDRTMDVNVRSLFELTRLSILHLAARASILNLSSVAGLRAYPGVLAYCVSKAAVDQPLRALLALELAPRECGSTRSTRGWW